MRYQFEAVSGDGPRYVQFNDHGHEPGAAEHFHIYFGDGGFDALADASTHPFFVPASLAAEQLLESLTEPMGAMLKPNTTSTYGFPCATPRPSYALSARSFAA